MNRKKSFDMKRIKQFMVRNAFRIVLFVGIAAIILASVSHFGLFKTPPTISVSSTLTDAVDIAQLSTAEFRYRGIAEVYTDDSRSKVQCRVCYSAVVKAGIDMDKVRFEVDAGNKTVTAELPEVDIKVTIIDEESMALLPSDADVELDRILTFSKEDAEREARNSTELIDTARENLKATIEALLYPVLKAYGYTLTWK